MNKQKPIVSVFMMTFNHEKYIAQALDGILMQKVNFNYEIVIGEDFSEDNTREIILDYKEKHPEIFNILLNKKNLGAQKNQYKVLNECKGKYIAICEGDDYWTDPSKLQKQVDFLEANEKYSACFHNAEVLRKNGEKSLFHKMPIKDAYGFNEIIRSWLIPTASLIFRYNKKIRDTFNYFAKFDIISGDKLFHAILGHAGKIKYIPEVMSVYRKHEGGISSWGKHDQIYTSNVLLYKQLKKLYKNRYNNALNDQISIWQGELAVVKIKEKKYLAYLKHLSLSFFHIRSFYTLKSWGKIYLLRLK